jgi:hypothetical protein
MVCALRIYDILLNLPDHSSSPLILMVLLLLAFYFDVQCFVDHFMCIQTQDEMLKLTFGIGLYPVLL